MRPIQVIWPECMDEFEADPLALEHHSTRFEAVSYPGENPLGTDPEDEMSRLDCWLPGEPRDGHPSQGGGLLNDGPKSRMYGKAACPVL